LTGSTDGKRIHTVTSLTRLIGRNQTLEWSLMTGQRKSLSSLLSRFALSIYLSVCLSMKFI